MSCLANKLKIKLGALKTYHLKGIQSILSHWSGHPVRHPVYDRPVRESLLYLISYYGVVSHLRFDKNWSIVTVINSPAGYIHSCLLLQLDFEIVLLVLVL